MKKIFIIIGIVLISGIFSLNTFGQTNKISTKKKKLAVINKKLKENKTKLTFKKKKEKLIVNHLGRLKRDLSLETRKLRKTQKKLIYYKKQNNITRKKLNKIQNEYREIEKDLIKRLSQVYKNEHLGFFEFIFSARDYSEAISQAYFFEKVMRSDIKLIKKIKHKRNNYLQKKIRLEDQTKKITYLTSLSKKKKHLLKNKSLEIEDNLSVLRQEIRKFEKQNKILEEESWQITKLIQGKTRGKRVFHAVGRFIKPVKGWISSRYGFRRHPLFRRRMFHSGIDIASRKGRQIRAANSGHILFSGWKKGYGNITIINHGFKNGQKYSTVYAHQLRMLVRRGQFVKKGQLIGYVGSTGYSTGPHLHFEMRINGRPVNPRQYVSI